MTASLKKINSYRLSASCGKLLRPTTIQDVSVIVSADPTIQVLSGGTNVVLVQQHYETLLHISDTLSRIDFDGTCIHVLAGSSLDKLCELACRRGMAGLAKLSGIPGTVGGAVTMNAGAFGNSICDVVTNIKCIRRRDGMLVELAKSDLMAAYRSTTLQDGAHVVVSISMNLLPDSANRQLALRAETLAKRREYPELPNAGSVFIRPRTGHAASWMIDAIGLKGTRIGGAEVSVDHAGFIVAHDGCTGDDILELTQYVRGRVVESFGVLLDVEQKQLGQRPGQRKLPGLNQLSNGA